MFDDIIGKQKSKKKMLIKKAPCSEPEYMLIKDEGFSKWFRCGQCGSQFEADGSGMNTKLIVNTGPTGKGRRLEPACPWCEPANDDF